MNKFLLTLSVIVCFCMLIVACSSNPEVSSMNTNDTDEEMSNSEESNDSVDEQRSIFDGKTDLTEDEQLAKDFIYAFYVDDEEARKEAIQEYMHADSIDFFLFISGFTDVGESVELLNMAVIESAKFEDEGKAVLVNIQFEGGHPLESIVLIHEGAISIILGPNQDDEEMKDMYEQLRLEFETETHPDILVAATESQDNASEVNQQESSSGEPELGTRHNPAQVGDAFSITFDDWMYGRADLQIQLLEVISGEEAWEIVREANQFNDRPEDGKEYALAKFTVDAITLEEEPIEINHAMFDYVTGGGTYYDEFISVSGLDPSLRSELYEGATHEGWTYFLIDVDDESPFAVFDRRNADVWFLLK